MDYKKEKVFFQQSLLTLTTPHGYRRPRIFSPLMSRTQLDPTTAKGNLALISHSCGNWYKWIWESSICFIICFLKTDNSSGVSVSALPITGTMFTYKRNYKLNFLFSVFGLIANEICLQVIQSIVFENDQKCLAKFVIL